MDVYLMQHNLLQYRYWFDFFFKVSSEIWRMYFLCTQTGTFQKSFATSSFFFLPHNLELTFSS